MFLDVVLIIVMILIGFSIFGLFFKGFGIIIKSLFYLILIVLLSLVFIMIANNYFDLGWFNNFLNFDQLNQLKFI